MTNPVPRAAFGRPPKPPSEKRVSVSHRFRVSSIHKLTALAAARNTNRTAILEDLIEQASIKNEGDASVS